jgi:hypothetical protein
MDAKNMKDRLFKKFDDLCSAGINTDAISALYIKTVGRINIIDDIFRIVNKVASKDSYGGNPKWDYLPSFFVTTERVSTGVQYIYIYHTTGPAKEAKKIFGMVNAKIYTKSGERRYYARVDGDKEMNLTTPVDLIERAIDTNKPGIRRFIFDALDSSIYEDIVDNMRSCNYTIKILPIMYDSFEEIPADFTITHKSRDTDDPVELKVHKFVVACFCDFSRKVAYGSGSISGVDKMDLSAFAIETVKWFANLIYNPTLTIGELNDDQWALLNYLNFDTRTIVVKACREIGINII